MAYEVEAITPSGPAAQSTQQPEMREERVLTPYEIKKPKTPLGQNTISKDVSTPAVEPGNVEEPKALTLSPAAAALARKEQQFRRQQEAFKADEATREKEKLELAEFRALKEKLGKDDYSDVESLIPYDKYTNYLIDKSAGVSPELEALKALSAKVETVETALKTDTEKRYEAAVNERRKAVNALVESKPEFSGIKKAKQQEAVVQHILDTWEHDGVELDPEVAAKEVEELLKEKAKKWRELYEEAEPTPAEKTETKDLPPLKAKVTTLTNDMSAVGENKRSPKSFRGMTDAERWAEARLRAAEKLKARG